MTRIFALAGGSGSNRGTGGMVTKLHAAQIATQAGIDTVVMSGEDPKDIYKLLDAGR
jgi:glutamate 5-kinase